MAAAAPPVERMAMRIPVLGSLMQDMLEELTATHGDVRSVRITVTMQVHTDASHLDNFSRFATIGSSPLPRDVQAAQKEAKKVKIGKK
jgi:hypothetical protein